MNLSRHSLLTATATILAAWAACPPAEAALREANGTGVRIEAEYILPSAGRSVNDTGTVGNFGTLHWVGRRSSNASGTVESTSEAPAVLFSGPASELTLANASVAENLSIGTVVGALAVTHMDNPTFSLTNDAGGRFALSGSNLTTGAILDFEANATRTVTARATDPNGGFVEKAFSITILDDDSEDADSDGLNEGEEETLGTSDLNADTDGDGFSDAKEQAAGSDPLDNQSLPAWLPTNFSLAPGEVAENRPAGTFAGKLTFTDPDGNRTYAYALVAEANGSTLDNSLFAIDANGSLSTTAKLDYEAASERRARVQVKDDYNRTAAATLTIKVLDLDEVAPVITLTGDANGTHEATTPWTEPGYAATDAVDGDLTASVTVSGTVQAGTKGAYSLTYSVSDSAGNAASATRVVTVQDTTPPVITLAGDANVTILLGANWTDPGYSVSDTLDGELSGSTSGSVDSNLKGTYVLTYSATDSSGNSATITRGVTVTDGEPPKITLLGDANATVGKGSAWADPGYAATDAEDGDLTASVQTSGTVEANALGAYVLTYSVTDSSGNSASVTRTVNVVKGSSLQDLLLTDGSVEENLAAGAFAGVVSAVFSGQGETSPVAYSLVSGAGGDDNAFFTLEANGTLRTAQALDFETKDRHSVRVRAEAESSSLEKTFAVSVIDAFVPIVDTIEPKAGATEGTLLLGGEVLDDGSSHASTERGIVLGRHPDPEPGGFGVTVLEAGLGLGKFEATPSNLVAGKKYYYRAFAKNAEGTSYGSQERFTAIKEPTGPAWASAQASGQAADWWTSQWFGSFFLGKNGWMRHETIGWLFAVDDGAGGVWLWQENLGWLWTGEGVYPYVFLNAEKGWGFLLGDAEGRVFIYRYADSSWFDVAEGTERK